MWVTLLEIVVEVAKIIAEDLIEVPIVVEDPTEVTMEIQEATVILEEEVINTIEMPIKIDSLYLKIFGYCQGWRSTKCQIEIS